MQSQQKSGLFVLIHKMFWTRKFDDHCKRFVGDLGWRLMKRQLVGPTRQVDEKILYWRGKDSIRRSHSPEEAVFCAIRDFADWYYQEHFDKRERSADFVEDCRTIASTLSILHDYVDQQRFLIPAYWKTFDERMKADWESSAVEAPAIDEVVISSCDIDECWNDLIDDLADDASSACYEAILKANLDAARVSEKTGVARVSDLLCMTDPVHASPKGSMHDHLERNPRRTAEGRGAP